MKQATKDKLKEAQQYCDDQDKSTEFMIQYMQDYAGVDFDCVMNYLQSDGGFKEVKTQPNVKKK